MKHSIVARCSTTFSTLQISKRACTMYAAKDMYIETKTNV